MENPNLQGRGRERGGQEFSLENNHSGRNSTNFQKTFAGAPEDNIGVWSSSLEQKRGFKILRQEEVDVSERFNIPRCASPMPFKQTTPQLNLPIPKIQTRSQYQRQNIPGTVKIMKRHTSPYPTPAPSPKSEALVANVFQPRRAYTCPAPAPDVTERYKEKMDMFLKSDLISKVDDPSRSPPFGSDDTDREPVLEHGIEANPVPDFFVNPAHANVTAPEFTWTSMSGSPNHECDLMNTDFIGTLGSVQDLDEDMRDYLPNTYSEYFPGPEASIQEVVTPVVTLQNVDLDRVTRLQKSETTNQMEGNRFLNTPVSINNDSGTGMSSPMGCQFSSKGTSKSAQENSIMSKGNTPNFASAAVPLEGLESGLGVIPYDANQSYPAGELTPPNSAYLSPSPSSVTFPLRELESPPQAKKLALDSITAIQTLILDPIMKNPALQEFRELCRYAKEEMQNGNIGSLKDVESMFLTTRGRATATSSRTYRQFANASLEGIVAAAARINDCDLRRPYDPVYDASYFTDKTHEVNQICVEDENKSTRNDEHCVTPEWEAVHGKRDVTPAQREGVAIAQKPHQRAQKRRLFGTADGLLPSANKPTINSENPPVAAHNLNGQQKLQFNEPIVQQTRQLGTQTQSLSDLNTYSHPHPHPTLNLMYDQSTGNAVAQAQSHNCQTYHDVCSEMLPPSVTPSFSFYPPSMPVSAESATPTCFTVSPTGKLNLAKRISGSTSRSKSSVPAFISNRKEEAHAFTCERCEKKFPRPCDLTKHRKTHERPFKCEVESCKYYTEGFPTSKECERHQNDIHAPDSKEWKCEFSPCQYKSKRESNCKQHMEKAHQYIYKRMKRNPRKRDHEAQVAAPTPRKRRNVQSTQQPPSTPMRTSSAVQWPSKDMEFPQTPPEQSRTNISPLEQAPSALSFGFVQQPHVSNLGNINLLESTQMQDIADGGLFQRSMNCHTVGTVQPFYENSPLTATEYEPSPVMTARSHFNYSNVFRGHPDASPTLASEALFPMQSAEQFMESFLSDFPGGNNGFSQPAVDNFPYRGLDYAKALDCEREGDTPD